MKEEGLPDVPSSILIKLMRLEEYPGIWGHKLPVILSTEACD